MKYRPEIDGLRALAVVPVILFHAGIGSFSGGFVGVDVFFVISGYLITTILIEDIEKQRFSLVNFYERRARRILPALFFVMVVSAVFAWILLGNASLNKFGNALIGVSLFGSNIVFWRQQGYFSESAELNPILHTWSLAVEEQYYVIFPVFLFLAWHFGKNRVFWIIAVFAAISLFLSEWGWRNQAMANFYLAPTRAWELLAGSIAAFIVQTRGEQSNNALSFLGLTAIVFAIFAYDETTPFPSVYALVPVAGVVLLVLYAGKETIAAKLLSRKAFVSIGVISYSAYLWHQPILSFYRNFKGTIQIAADEILIIVLVTFVLAFLSWKFIERPFRNREKFNSLYIFSLSISSLLILGCIGFASKVATKDYEYQLASLLVDNEFIYFENMDERRFVEGRLLYDLRKVNHIIVGSSRAMQIASETIGEPVLNLSVSGASIEDDVALLLEAESKLSPQFVYIGADPWLLNRLDNQDRYKSIQPMYDYWLSAISGEKKGAHVSFLNEKSNVQIKSPVVDSLQALYHLINYSKSKIPENGHTEATAKTAFDGSHIYNEVYVNSDRGDIAKGDDVLNYAMKDFEYDETAKEVLVSMIEYLNEKEVKITLVLSPYHPDLYLRMEKEKPIFLKIEEDFRQIALDNDTNVLGSYNPLVVGCTAVEFYDGMHPKGSCMTKVLNFIK